MNKAKKIKFINELNGIINEYVVNYNLFSGGCCYAAFIIASCLDILNIKYKTVIFQYHNILNVRNFNKAINGNGVAHVAIEVKVNGTKTFIGDCDGIYKYFNITQQEYKVRHYSRVNPHMLLEGYMNNAWNWVYNTENNTNLAQDVSKILDKYIGF